MFIAYYNYIVFIILLVIGLYILSSNRNLIRKLIGLNIMQTSVLLFYISLGYVANGSIPILNEQLSLYHNPVPHVLMLTAIVVGVSTFAIGLSIAIRIEKEFGSIEESIINKSHYIKHGVDKT